MPPKKALAAAVDASEDVHALLAAGFDEMKAAQHSGFSALNKKIEQLYADVQELKESHAAQRNLNEMSASGAPLRYARPPPL